MKKLLLALLLLSQSVVNAQLQYIYTPDNSSESVVILDDKSQYHVVNGGVEVPVQSCFVDPLIRNIKAYQLVAFLDLGGYMIVDTFTDGEYYIKAKMRVVGGGKDKHPFTKGWKQASKYNAMKDAVREGIQGEPQRDRDWTDDALGSAAIGAGAGLLFAGCPPVGLGVAVAVGVSSFVFMPNRKAPTTVISEEDRYEQKELAKLRGRQRAQRQFLAEQVAQRNNEQ